VSLRPSVHDNAALRTQNNVVIVLTCPLDRLFMTMQR